MNISYNFAESRADVTVFTTSSHQSLGSQYIFSATEWTKASTLGKEEIQVVNLVPQRRARYVAILHHDFLNIAEVEVYQPLQYTGNHHYFSILFECLRMKACQPDLCENFFFR